MAPRKKTRTTGSAAGSIAALVARNAELEAENSTLKAELDEVHSALGTVPGSIGSTGGKRRGRPPGGQTVDQPVKKTRRPITDPEVLARKRAALAKARAARAAKREAGNGTSTADVPAATEQTASKPKRVRKPKIGQPVGPSVPPLAPPANTMEAPLPG
jgi:hypothetical protein